MAGLSIAEIKNAGGQEAYPAQCAQEEEEAQNKLTAAETEKKRKKIDYQQLGSAVVKDAGGEEAYRAQLAQEEEEAQSNLPSARQKLKRIARKRPMTLDFGLWSIYFAVM